MWMNRLVRYVMAGSLAVSVLAWWMQDALPPPARLQAELDAEPKQIRVSRPVLKTSVNGVDYRIQPRYSYDISALIVSLHHSDSWWDYAHKAWDDHINLMDLCVVWGESARSGAYRAISFSNNQWECAWSASSREAWNAFNQAEVSNNHMVTDDPAIARALRQLHVGDQVRVRGYLVDYTTFRNGVPAGTRVSSEVRTDTGNGACEVLYVESLELLDSAGRGWRLLLKIALALLVLAALAWLFLPATLEN
jgi:hypothetical protein